MATATSLRSRRTEAQLHALAGVQAHIEASDPKTRSKYLQEFSQAFQSYESVIAPEELKHAMSAADMVLIGDYHALPVSQRFAAGLLEERAQPGDRPIVLGLEAVFSRDQHIVNEWWRREIAEAELRTRLHFDRDWGYDWISFYELLVTARQHCEAIYGLDCMPRHDLRKIGARDRHAAHKLAEIRSRHPQAVVVGILGESHLAPQHLPRLLREKLPQERLLTVLQNVDKLYWKAAGEQHDGVEAVRVSRDVVCVFNSTPLEKYENYRLCLDRWGQYEAENEEADLAPTIYNLIDGLLRFLGINRYSSHNGTQPKFLIDLLPEIHSDPGGKALELLVSRRALDDDQGKTLLRRLEEHGSIYLPELKAFYVSEFRMESAAEDVARFLHHACRGLPGNDPHDGNSQSTEDVFFRSTLEHALAFFGSRVLNPAREPARTSGEVSFLGLKRQAAQASRGELSRLQEGAQQAGYVCGSELYGAFVAGNVSRSKLRHLFLANLSEPGGAGKACREMLRAIRTGRKKALLNTSAK